MTMTAKGIAAKIGPDRYQVAMQLTRPDGTIGDFFGELTGDQLSEVGLQVRGGQLVPMQKAVGITTRGPSLVIDLAKAEQLGLFGPRDTSVRAHPRVTQTEELRGGLNKARSIKVQEAVRKFRLTPSQSWELWQTAKMVRSDNKRMSWAKAIDLAGQTLRRQEDRIKAAGGHAFDTEETMRLDRWTRRWSEDPAIGLRNVAINSREVRWETDDGRTEVAITPKPHGDMLVRASDGGVMEHLGTFLDAADAIGAVEKFLGIEPMAKGRVLRLRPSQVRVMRKATAGMPQPPNTNVRQPNTSGIPEQDPGTKAPPRPGLMLKRAKTGTARRWQREGPEQPKEDQQRAPADEEGPEEGQQPEGEHDHHVGKTVRFKDAAGSVMGQVIAAGAKGVTVVDESGRKRKVEHGKHLHAEDQAEGQGQDQPEGQAPEAEGQPAAGQDEGQAPEAEGQPAAGQDEGQDQPEGGPKLPDNFDNLTKEQQGAVASSWTDMQAKIRKRFGEPEIDGSSIAAATTSAKAYMAELADQDWIGDYNVENYGLPVIDVLGQHLNAAGVSGEDAAAILGSTAQKLAHQEHESIRRTLGDHGLRHVGVNVRALEQILDSIASTGEDLPPIQRLAGVMAMITHDLGYTVHAIAEDKRWGKFHPQASAILWRQEQKASPAMQRVFGDKLGKKMMQVINSHSSHNVDWKNDRLGSAMRLADNTHLFQDKMPELFFSNPDAMETLVKLHLARQNDGDWEAVRDKMQADLQARTDLEPPEKAALLEAVEELTGVTPKFLVSRLAGRDARYEWDEGNKTMNVAIEQSPLRHLIGRTFGADHQDRQFVKMLGDFGVGPGRALRSGPPPQAKIGSATGNGYVNFTWNKPESPTSDREKAFQKSMVRTVRAWKAAQEQGDEAVKKFWSS